MRVIGLPSLHGAWEVSKAVPLLEACPNCSRSFAGPVPRFCPDCGQETDVEPPSLLQMAQQFGGAYLSTEGALWRTLALLVTRPGELTRQYLEGRRKHFVLPLRLYLTTGVVTLLFLRLVVSLTLDAAGPALGGHPPPRRSEIRILTGSAGVEDGAFFCRGLPEWLCARLEARMPLDPAARQRWVAAYARRFAAQLGTAMFVLVPAFAGLVQLAHARRRRRYSEHLIFALHLHAFWFLALCIAEAPSRWISAPAAAAIPAYGVLAMRRVYGGRWWALLLRAGAIAVLYLAAIYAAVTALVVWALAF